MILIFRFRTYRDHNLDSLKLSGPILQLLKTLRNWEGKITIKALIISFLLDIQTVSRSRGLKSWRDDRERSSLVRRCKGDEIEIAKGWRKGRRQEGERVTDTKSRAPTGTRPRRALLQAFPTSLALPFSWPHSLPFSLPLPISFFFSFASSLFTLVLVHHYFPSTYSLFSTRVYCHSNPQTQWRNDLHKY